jgi:hypothetical protein
LLLEIGRAAIGDRDGRLRWLDADLAGDEWPALLGAEQVDAALSTTALHWLEGGALLRLYRRLAGVLRPGGVFLNGERTPAPVQLPALRTLEERWQERQDGGHERMMTGWNSWWADLRREPGIGALYAEHDRRDALRNREDATLTVDVHLTGLRAAGFAQVCTIWQNLNDHVLLGVR